MGTDNARDRGRESFTRWAWGEAYAQLSAADLEAPLEPEDLDRLATAAFLLGHDAAGQAVWARAHHGFLGRGDAERAARCAFWLGFTLLHRGEIARGGGWLATAQRVLDDAQLDCVERGYLLIPVGIRCIREGDGVSALETFGAAAAIAERFRDPDLSALSRHGRGRTLVRLGRAAEGVSLLDEVMVSVTAGEVSPMVAGVVYCSVIEACRELFDLRRAREWTEALTRWCVSQPTSCHSAANASCTVPRSCRCTARGPTPSMPRSRRASASCNRPTTLPRVRPSTSRVRSSGCEGTSPRPRSRTAGRANGATSRSRGWRCCA